MDEENLTRKSSALLMPIPENTNEEIKERLLDLEKLRQSGQMGEALDAAYQLYNDTVKDLDLKEVPLYFGNDLEETLYAMRHDDYEPKEAIDVPVFEILYTLGSLLVECHYPEEAKKILKQAWEVAPYNPIAALEYIESLKATQDFEEAEDAIAEALTFTIEPVRIAHLFRDLGFVLIEEDQLFLASFFFINSLGYEKNPSALMELAYIEELCKGKRPEGDEETIDKYLEEKDIILSPEFEIIQEMTEYMEEFANEYSPDTPQ